MIEHQILVDKARPIRKPQHRVPYSLRKQMKTQVENMLQEASYAKEPPLRWPHLAITQTKYRWETQI